MNESINIPAILKGKPQGTKLHDLVRGIDVFLTNVVDDSNEVHCTFEKNGLQMLHYSSKGTLVGFENGMVVLLPSKEMRDWSKFSWKKGDILTGNNGTREVLFHSWANDSYTKFIGLHCMIAEDIEGFVYDEGTTVFNTNDFKCIEDEYAVQCYISTIEERLGGKLNRETLEIEPAQPEFKDGDIAYADYGNKQAVFIVSGKTDLSEGYNSFIALDLRGLTLDMGCRISFFKKDLCKLRLATEEEKQQLIDALAKEGKAWDAEKKQVVDLKPKIKLKPFDKVLVRDSKSDKWRANLLGYIDEDGYFCCAFAKWIYCIPYEGNEHLLGTTKDVED